MYEKGGVYMDISKLQERLVKNQEKLTKTCKTLENHKKQLAKKYSILLDLGYDPKTGCDRSYLASLPNKDPYWAMCDYEDKVEAVRNTEKKIEDIKSMIDKITTQIDIEVNKDNFINNTAPPVILEFLENWKRLAYSWYQNRYNQLVEFRKTKKNEVYQVKMSSIANDDRYANYRGRNLSDYDMVNLLPRKPIEDELKRLKLDYSSLHKAELAFGTEAIKLASMYNDKERHDYLMDMLEKEKRSLLFDLLDRITKVTGEIVNASDLELSVNGQINGIVVGKKGTVHVETIGAGGYNIQCFHFRTLVKPVK